MSPRRIPGHRHSREQCVRPPRKERSESLLCDQLICLRSCDSGLVKGIAKSPDITAEDINIMFSTNTIGLINMTQAILPIFKKRDQGGRGDIINIGSIAGREAYPGGSVYCAAKAAVRSFSDALRKELIATRVRVIEIDPGQVETVRGKDDPYSILDL